jgi:large subunit ribosomal protein L10
MPHIAQWKKDEVKDLKNLIESYPVVGMANLSDIPAPQLQQMRQSLRGNAQVKMSRKTLMDLALKKAKKTKVEILVEHMEGQPALIFTDMNPFKLYKILESSKTPAPARAGSIATSNIVVPKGETGFMPGPILGELQKIGIPAKIDKGKIVISEDKTIVSEGEEISKDVASMLTRLEIYPLEVGIDLRAAYEDETVYTSNILFIDENITLSDIQSAYNRAFNLSVNGMVYNKVSTPALLAKAADQSLNLALNAEILTSKTTNTLLAKAYSQMLSLASEAFIHNAESVDSEIQEKLSSTVNKAEIKSVDEKEEKQGEEEKEDEEEKEKDAAEGLGALFG